MKSIVLGLCMMLLSADAHAISRYTSTSISCDQVQAAIAQDGAALMQHRSTRVSGLLLYDRYVSDRRFCPSHQVTEMTYVPSADRGSCPVRHCVDPHILEPNR
jgi:hypothetical protein